jgi:hypothetical protein
MHLTRTNAIISVVADVDLTGQEGRFVRISNNESICLVDYALEKPLGLLLTGGKANERVTLAIPGGLAGTVRVKIYGPISFGELLQLTSTGCVEGYSNDAPRMVVGVALEAGKTGELIEAALYVPTYTPAA